MSERPVNGIDHAHRRRCHDAQFASGNWVLTLMVLKPSGPRACEHHVVSCRFDIPWQIRVVVISVIFFSTHHPAPRGKQSSSSVQAGSSINIPRIFQAKSTLLNPRLVTQVLV